MAQSIQHCIFSTAIKKGFARAIFKKLKGAPMNALRQYATLELMLQNKPKVSIKEALNAIETVEKLTKKPRTFLTIKYQVRLHVRSAA